MKNRLWKDLCRSWSQHTGTQVATLTVLAATFTVITTVLVLSLNLQRVLNHWGRSVHMTVYLNDEIKPDEVSTLKTNVEKLGVFSSIDYISKEEAKGRFEKDLANILPSLVKDKAFGNPFPSSFELGLQESLVKKSDLSVLNGIAETISKMVGVEDLTYGQDWVKNYASLLNGLNQFGVLLIFILLLGSILVIGSGLKSAISQRREEIEIMELVGATYRMIRRPYIVDGAVTGFISGVLAVLFSYVLFNFGVDVLKSQIEFLSLNSHIKFLNLGASFLVIFCATLFGLLGSFLAVRQINGGYAAIKKVNK